MSEESKSLDVFGIKPLADAANAITKGGVAAASAFLGRICLPAAEEFGLLLRDKVSAWRARNAIAIAEKAEAIANERQIQPDDHAHPRLVGQIIESGSWTDSDEVQDLWAGLLASSCDATGRDDSNLMFVDLLTRMSVSQVRILNHSVNNAVKYASAAGWIAAQSYVIDSSALLEVAGLTDIHQLDRELDHLRTLGLIGPTSGFNPFTTSADLTPSALGLQMFARCHGHRGDPLTYFGVVAPAT